MQTEFGSLTLVDTWWFRTCNSMLAFISFLQDCVIVITVFAVFLMGIYLNALSGCLKAFFKSSYLLQQYIHYFILQVTNNCN